MRVCIDLIDYVVYVNLLPEHTRTVLLSISPATTTTTCFANNTNNNTHSLTAYSKRRVHNHHT